MAKPVSIFGKESSNCNTGISKPMLSRVFIVGSSIIALITFQHAVATEVNNDNQPQKASPVLQSIIDAARQSATESYEQDDHGLNSKLKEIDYTTYRSIRFKPEQSLWHGENDYELQFFHPGFLYEYPVTIHTIGESNKPERLAFNSDMFNYDGSASGLAGLTDEKSGFAGFRVHYPIKNEEYKDEFAVFLGASYFRLVGKNQVYGFCTRRRLIPPARGENFLTLQSLDY